MRNIIILLLVLNGAVCLSNELEKDFEKLVSLSSKEYLTFREEILKNPELKGFLQNKLQKKKTLPLLHEAEAYILLEWLERKNCIQSMLKCQVLNLGPFVDESGQYRSSRDRKSVV